MHYQYNATSVPGFIQQLAVSYIHHGYFFYVAGHVPPGKLPQAVDRVLLRRYGVALSRWQRARRKVLGKANVHYLRYNGFWVLLANHGEHEFFEREKTVIRDVRREPIAFAGYSIGYGDGVDGTSHVSVRIHQNEYKWLRQWMTQFAAGASTQEVAEEFRRLRFEPYAPVVRQLFNILRATNRVLRDEGRAPVEASVIRLRRKVVRPFEPLGNASAA